MNYQTLKDTHITGLYREELNVMQPCGIGDLNRMMQQVTEHAMERLGISVEELQISELLWVICFSQIEITRMPREGEELVIYSWPGAEKMGMFTRRYAAFTKEGEEIFTAASLFSLVNEKTRVLVLPSDSGFILPLVTLVDEPKLPKLTARGSEGEKETLHLVKAEEIDHNGHVNNAYYLDWAEEVLQEEAPGQAQDIRSIWIGYSKEILEGDTVAMRYACSSPQLFLRGYVNGESCFTIVTK
ncbi:MAG: hypothetical protein IKG67_03010 [Parasporobacterium sp.]|nr:hypothetical protein [Parasporobacterium sp.]